MKDQKQNTHRVLARQKFLECFEKEALDPQLSLHKHRKPIYLEGTTRYGHADLVLSNSNNDEIIALVVFEETEEGDLLNDTKDLIHSVEEFKKGEPIGVIDTTIHDERIFIIRGLNDMDKMSKLIALFVNSYFARYNQKRLSKLNI